MPHLLLFQLTVVLVVVLSMSTSLSADIPMFCVAHLFGPPGELNKFKESATAWSSVLNLLTIGPNNLSLKVARVYLSTPAASVTLGTSV